ncbi:aminotransferase class V-fold PLP-dependent enzyme, partial [archaeon]
MRRHANSCSLVLKKHLSNSLRVGEHPRRKSFGSFHSEHIDVLLRQPKESFIVPDIVHEIRHKVVQRFPILSQPKLDLQDRDAWKSLFFTEPSWTFLNHGAFGGALRPILYESQLYREYCESQPLRFYDRDYFPLLANSFRQMGEMLQIPSNSSHSKSSNTIANSQYTTHYTQDTTSKIFHTSLTPTLLPIANVTSGLNAIMNTYAHILKPTDTIAYLSLTYGSTKKVFMDLALRTGCELKEIPISLPIPSPTHLMHTILTHITPQVKLLVLDEITSNTAIHLPIHTLAPLIKASSEHNCAIIVDAAHSLYATPVNVGRYMGVDYWLTNGHKWLCNAKGGGLMYVFHPVSTSPSSP